VQDHNNKHRLEAEDNYGLPEEKEKETMTILYDNNKIMMMMMMMMMALYHRRHFPIEVMYYGMRLLPSRLRRI